VLFGLVENLIEVSKDNLWVTEISCN
jgi:hypothetical protein